MTGPRLDLFVCGEGSLFIAILKFPGRFAEAEKFVVRAWLRRCCSSSRGMGIGGSKACGHAGAETGEARGDTSCANAIQSEVGRGGRCEGTGIGDCVMEGGEVLDIAGRGGVGSERKGFPAFVRRGTSTPNFGRIILPVLVGEACFSGGGAIVAIIVVIRDMRRSCVGSISRRSIVRVSCPKIFRGTQGKRDCRCCRCC